jgi:hypothetical protein
MCDTQTNEIHSPEIHSPEIYYPEPSCPVLTQDEYHQMCLSAIHIVSVRRELLRKAPAIPVQSIYIRSIAILGKIYDFFYEIPVGLVTDNEFSELVYRK